MYIRYVYTEMFSFLKVNISQFCERIFTFQPFKLNAFDTTVPCSRSNVY